ncbi:ion channel pore / TrkA domain protein [Halobacterium hubeiense]|uniref:Ion channel pore / TrkA domain protein n=1 Tax=Halobacterium hubeiense TaxID=1407499 RepID=A0A0U5H330_9EURY|nr:NAD-binding protein [Halobacterium hubeiense]CQH53461.1 ion channel pore / TrkA domain protein [Halobacterium hubeiense]
MSRQGRRVLAYAGLLAAVAATYTVAFKHGMAFFEGDELTYVESLQFVGQTFTTTGYGEYAPWTSNVMLITVVVMQLSGVFLIFLTLPLFVVPWIEERLEVEPPRSVDLEGHVVICGFGARDETLAAELDAQGVEYVVLTDDRETALSLYEDGWQAVHGDPETERGLERVNVADARTVVLDESDERNATIALTVGDLAPDVQTVCFVEDPSLAEYLRYAGADRVLGPREILGRSLARNVTTTISSRLGDAVEIGEDFEIVEMPVQYGSDLDGATLGDTDLLEPGGVNAVGAWFAGEFVGSPDPDRELTRNTVLLVAGREDELEAFEGRTLAPDERGGEHVVVAGYGEVGSTVREVLDEEDIDTTVVDVEDRPGVDVVGDATEGGTLRSAGIEDATALVLALGDDTSTVFATLVAREASERVEILCRANDTESARKLYAAGADYVLSLATVAGRMLAQTILDEDVMALDKQIDVVRTEAPALVGQTLAEADVRARTGCTVVAVQRGGEVVSQPDASFRVRDGDALVVVGADADVAQFNELAGVHATPP